MQLKDMDTAVLQAGDVLVLRPSTHLTNQQMDCLSEEAIKYSEALGIKVLVVQHGLDVYAVRQEG